MTGLLQMIEAIRFVHSKHVLHGDIKLNNWVIRTSNASPFGMNIALIDFGTAPPVDQLASSLADGWFNNDTNYVLWHYYDRESDRYRHLSPIVRATSLGAPLLLGRDN